MFAFGALTLHWVEYQSHMILILRLNINISVWMFRHSKHKVDIEVEYQILFGWSNIDIDVDLVANNHIVIYACFVVTFGSSGWIII